MFRLTLSLHIAPLVANFATRFFGMLWTFPLNRSVGRGTLLPGTIPPGGATTG